MNGDEAHGLWRIHAAQPLDNARAQGAGGTAGQRFAQHKLVRLGAAAVARVHDVFVLGLAVDGHNAATALTFAIDAQHLVHAGAQPLDDGGLKATARFGEPREDAFAGAEHAAAIVFLAGDDDDLRRLFIALPALRAGEQLAVGILSGDFEDGDVRQRAGFFKGTVRAARQRALGFEFFQDSLQCNAVVALHAERAGNVAFGGLWIFGKRFENARLG